MRALRAGAGSPAGSIPQPYASAQNVGFRERGHSRLRARYQLAISPMNFFSSFSTTSLLTFATG
jgi:hypothetical protein